MDCKTANRMMVPFLEGALSLEETDHFLKHIKECSGCREDLEIYYTVRTAIDGMDQDRFKTYNLKHTLGKQLRPCSPVDAAVNTAASQKGAVRCIDDSIYLHFCDVVSYNLKRHITTRLSVLRISFFICLNISKKRNQIRDVPFL